MADIEYLENERKLLWQEVNNIKDKELKPLQEKINNIANTIPEDIKEFKSAKHSIDLLKTAYREYKNQYEDITKKCDEAQKQAEAIGASYKDIEKIKLSLHEINQDIIQNAEVIKKAIEKNLDLPTKIGNTIDAMDAWNANYKLAGKQAQEIKQKYIEIFGGESIDERGNTLEVAGLVSELSDSYNELQNKMSLLENKVQTQYNSKIEEWNTTYSTLKNKIEELLPGSMSAGLAYAFIEKRTREQDERKNAAWAFYIAIISLVIISFLPVFINLKLLTQSDGLNIQETINTLGKMVWMMFPIYVPILWVAIFANKRINLSKKLIEEYSHKEVIAKTYEGLASQIQKLDSNEVSIELRNKLIDNTLNASSDNPSKYITNFDRCDNPVTEILNNKNLLNLVRNENFDTIFERLKNLLDISIKNKKTTYKCDKREDEKEIE